MKTGDWVRFVTGTRRWLIIALDSAGMATLQNDETGRTVTVHRIVLRVSE